MASHLSIEEREVISQMRFGRRKARGIARRLGRHRSTIYRELARNRDSRGYSAVRAQRRAVERRRQRPLVGKMDRPKLRREVCQGLTHYWSPEQIAGRMRRRRHRQSASLVSHQTIYDWIEEQPDRRYWEQFLRFGGQRRKRRDRRGKIPRTVQINRRPAAVNGRHRYGDWEGDTVLGIRRHSALVTHVERKSGYLLAAKIEAKQSAPVNRASYELFRSLPPKLRRTLTLDNGKEFAGYEDLSGLIGIAIYFAQPYAAWQRGTNENTNGLLRQHFPKGTDFDRVTTRDLKSVVRLINDRPRKRLKYRTPNEILHNSPHVAFEN
jgi:transposase, IS30 family